MMKFDIIHRQNINKRLRGLKKLFNNLIYEISSEFKYLEEQKGVFSFDQLKRKRVINELFLKFKKSLLIKVEQGIEEGWNLANEKMTSMEISMLKSIENSIPIEEFERRMLRINKDGGNQKLLEKLKTRTFMNFTLSQRVNFLTLQIKKEIEYAIDLHLSEVKTSRELERVLRKSILNPDKLYKGISLKYGSSSLHRFEQKLYRSSLKNAIRLAGNEQNIAYRESEQERINVNPDVVGVEIHLRSQHKVYDMCDELAGKYPKNFQWNQWHVNCKCHRRMILKTEEELIQEIKAGIINPSSKSVNYVGELPDNFHKWVEKNGSKMIKWKRKPEFLKLNFR